MLVTVKRTNQDFTSSSPTTIAIFFPFWKFYSFLHQERKQAVDKKTSQKKKQIFCSEGKRETQKEKRMEERTRWTRITGTSDVSLCSGNHGNVNIDGCKRAPGMLAPPSRSNFFNFCAKILPNNRFLVHIQGLVPPPVWEI